jgi:hypothetical protein
MTEMLKVFSRIKQTSDGIDFIAFLEELSKQNVSVFKRCTADMNDVVKGQLIAIDSLVDLFNTCDDKLRAAEEAKQDSYDPASNPNI